MRPAALRLLRSLAAAAALAAAVPLSAAPALQLQPGGPVSLLPGDTLSLELWLTETLADLSALEIEVTFDPDYFLPGEVTATVLPGSVLLPAGMLAPWFGEPGIGTFAVIFDPNEAGGYDAQPAGPLFGLALRSSGVATPATPVGAVGVAYRYVEDEPEVEIPLAANEVQVRIETAVIPEPSTHALLLAGLLGLVAIARRRIG